MMCEKCWKEAYEKMLTNTKKSQTDHYFELLQSRKENPCTPEEQAGEWWDEEKQLDTRKSNPHE